MNCVIYKIKNHHIKDNEIYYDVTWDDGTTSLEPEYNLNNCPIVLSNYNSKIDGEKCFLYCRVSTIPQTNTKNGRNSLDVQENIMRKYASDNNFTVYGCFKDKGLSAANMNNQFALKKLIKCLKKGDKLLFNDISRFSRNMKQGKELLNTLYKKGVICVSVSENLQYNEKNKNLYEMILFSAEYELKKISNGVKNSIIYRKLNGGFIGKTPYGYRSIRNRKGIRKLIKNKKEQNILKISRGIVKPNKMKVSKYMIRRNDNKFNKYLIETNC
jgi:DNA invertase Pin-like site-specific DNA recombinase